MPYLLVRYDVDNIADWGMQARMVANALTNEGINATFFINCGQAFHISSLFRGNAGRKDKNIPEMESVSLLKKTGVLNAALTVLRNPAVGKRQVAIGYDLMENGHELALHGGKNHALWQWRGKDFGYEAFDKMMWPAYQWFCENYRTPAGFSSPGFVCPSAVLDLMDKYGFKYGVDLKGRLPFRPNRNGVVYNHIQIPATLATDYGVPLIENLFARGLHRNDILNRMIETVLKSDFAVYYSHPSLDSKYIEIVLTFLKTIKENGWLFATHEEFVHVCKDTV